MSYSGNHGDAIFGHHLNIGSLIGLFCEGLQEQIQSRVYFYKNSKLVHTLVIASLVLRPPSRLFRLPVLLTGSK